MKINIYYGGRAMVDDPTIFVINKVQQVLQELNVQVERFNIYEIKNAITTLPQTLKSADGIILATTVEWYGLGGYMASFLDAIWLFGDKEKISQLYMCPIAMSTTYGERKAKTDMENAWEILGGIPCGGICGYIKDVKELKTPEYVSLIEKTAENLYRTVHQKIKNLPASNQAVIQTVAVDYRMELTPQESEQLSRYTADESYVQRQKEDIEELASLFKGILSDKEPEKTNDYEKYFTDTFHAVADVNTVFTIRFEDNTNVLQLTVKGKELSCTTYEENRTEIEMVLKEEILIEIIGGRMTFQRAFMTGAMKMKGDFTKFRQLDDLFPFS